MTLSCFNKVKGDKLRQDTMPYKVICFDVFTMSGEVKYGL